MRTRALLVGLAVIGAILVSVSGVQAKPVQEGAFLTEYAAGVDEVIQQVEANRLVALRYAKHFRMDPASVLVYFRNELSLATLDDAAAMMVYSIGDSSRIVSNNREFKRGAKVFVDRHGVPILEYGTGNPLGTSIQPVEQVKDESAPKPQESSTNGVVQAADQSPPQQGLTTPAPQNAQPVIVPTNSITPPVTAPPAGEAGPIIPEITHPRSSNWLLPLELAGAVAAVAGGSGSSSSAIPPGGGRTNAAVPEPVSMTVMASGLSAFAGGILWKKRRRRA